MVKFAIYSIKHFFPIFSTQSMWLFLPLNTVCETYYMLKCRSRQIVSTRNMAINNMIQFNFAYMCAFMLKLQLYLCIQYLPVFAHAENIVVVQYTHLTLHIHLPEHCWHKPASVHILKSLRALVKNAIVNCNPLQRHTSLLWKILHIHLYDLFSLFLWIRFRA